MICTMVTYMAGAIFLVLIMIGEAIAQVGQALLTMAAGLVQLLAQTSPVQLVTIALLVLCLRNHAQLELIQLVL